VGRWKVTATGKFQPDTSTCNPGTCEYFANNVWNHPHGVVQPPEEASKSGFLVVFLPGTGGTYTGYTRVLKAAARAGHVVLSLQYLSHCQPVSGVNQYCEGHPPGYTSTPDECTSDYFEQVLFGDTHVNSVFKGKSGELWPVRRQDSVEGRLEGILSNQSWGSNFLSDGRVDWSKVIISGHSQGASHAAYLSQLKGVRTVLISGPQDNVAGTSRWTAQPAPPATVMRRSLHHLHEECAEEAKNQDFYGQALTIPINLQRMGFGPVVQWNGDKLPAEKDLENVASTVAVLPACETRPGRPYHSGVAADLCAAASYDALWQALFTLPSPEAPEERGSHADGGQLGYVTALIRFLLHS